MQPVHARQEVVEGALVRGMREAVAACMCQL